MIPIFMPSLHKVHKSNTYWEVRSVSPSIYMFYLQNHEMDFDEVHALDHVAWWREKLHHYQESDLNYSVYIVTLPTELS